MEEQPLLGMEKWLTALFQGIRRFLLTLIAIVFTPRRLVRSLDSDEKIYSEPYTFLAITIFAVCWVGARDFSPNARFFDTDPPSSFADLMYMTIPSVVCVAICVKGLSLLFFRLRAPAKTLLCYGTGLVSLGITFALTYFGDKESYTTLEIGAALCFYVGVISSFCLVYPLPNIIANSASAEKRATVDAEIRIPMLGILAIVFFVMYFIAGGIEAGSRSLLDGIFHHNDPQFSVLVVTGSEGGAVQSLRVLILNPSENTIAVNSSSIRACVFRDRHGVFIDPIKFGGRKEPTPKFVLIKPHEAEELPTQLLEDYTEETGPPLLADLFVKGVVRGESKKWYPEVSLEGAEHVWIKPPTDASAQNSVKLPTD